MTETSKGLISDLTTKSVVLNTALFQYETNKVNFTTCKKSLYYGDTPKYLVKWKGNCEGHEECDSLCTVTTISDIYPGTPYILFIEAAIDGYTQYDEKIFFKPSNNALVIWVGLYS